MKSLLLLLVVPVVLGGGPEFMKMWSDMEKEMGRAMPEPSPSDVPMAGDGGAADVPSDEMMKQMQKMMGWSEEQKQAMMKESAEAMKGWSGEPMKGWGEEPMKGWGEEPMKGWGEEPMKGWGEEPMKGWSDEQQMAMADAQKQKMLEAFKSFMKEHAGQMNEEEHKQKAAAAFEEFMKKYKEHEAQMAKEKMEAMHQAALEKHDLMMNFKQYMMHKKQEKMEQQYAKEAMMKSMKQMKMQQMLSEKLAGMMEEYGNQKLMFVAGVTEQFLSFCKKAGSEKNVMMRIKAGHFGDEQQMRNAGGMGDQTAETPSPEDTAAQHEQMKEAFVHKFLGLEHKEQAKLVMQYMVESMCHAAEGVISHLSHLEAELLHQMQNKAIAG